MTAAEVRHSRCELQAVAGLHEIEVLHSIVKPQNVLIVDDEAGLSDFEVTCFTDRPEEVLR